MPLALTKTFPRLWSLNAGIAMVVTDLHGDWNVYQRYRDRFVDLQAKEQADCIIFTGDLIHADPPIQDSSLPIVLDILRLRVIYGEAIIDGMRRAYARLSQAHSYKELARHYLAVSGPNDPRYDDLLRGFVATTSPDFQILHTTLFTRCEQEYGLDEYAGILRRVLQHLSSDYAPQQVLVAGHMTVQNGLQIIAEKHLRIASGNHAKPRKTGTYLLFDTARPVNRASDLLPNLHSVHMD